MLPDRSILIGQKLVENAKIGKYNETFWVIFEHYKIGCFLKILFDHFTAKIQELRFHIL